jgi:hypothetical protein
MRAMRRHWIRRGLKVVLIATVAIGVFGLLVMVLWNWLVPTLFRGPALTFGEAVGVLLLSKILFGGLRGRGGPGPWFWRRRLMERWEQMTPEERERFRQGIEKRWGPSGPAPAPNA